jgi:hypothetical protein
MPRGQLIRTCTVAAVLTLIAVVAPVPSHAVEPTAAAVSAFDKYMATLEARISKQHQSKDNFVASVLSDPNNRAKLKRGESVLERLTPADPPDLPGAMLHHWRGTAFVPGAKVADFERLMEDFPNFPKTFAPDIVQSRILGRRDEPGRTTIQTEMRVKQHHVITVVMDIAYDVDFARLDPQHGYSISRGTQIKEIASAGTKDEHAMSGADQHGFLWRLNTYWSYEESDGGLYMQIESVSLTRAIPAGFGWALKPFIESVPRESLEFTLQSATNALRK